MDKRWSGLGVLAGAAAMLLAALGVARAQDVAVDLELVLAVDVSRSMDYEEQSLQRDGYVAAFRHPEVIDAIRSGTHGRIAVTYVEWAGVATTRQPVPWGIIDGDESAAAFASRLEVTPILPGSRTSISSGLAFAASLFDGNGIEGIRRVIDISGDGPNNQGEPVETARQRVLEQGITINGLPIQLKAGTLSGGYDVRNLDSYYEDCVIGGFGAFLVPVTKVEEFVTAIRRKLILEIAGRDAGVLLAQAQAPPAKTDCMTGEVIWQRRWD